MNNLHCINNFFYSAPGVSHLGIDVEQVTVVVNFDLPVDMQHQADCETYLHRSVSNYSRSKTIMVTPAIDVDLIHVVAVLSRQTGSPQPLANPPTNRTCRMRKFLILEINPTYLQRCSWTSDHTVVE